MPKVDEAQARRDRHYFEDGVDEQGNAPKGVEFDEHGNAHKVEATPEASDDSQPDGPTDEDLEV